MAQMQPNRQGKPEAINNLTYDLATLLANCGDAVDALDEYIEDAKSCNDQDAVRVFQQIRDDENRHCDMVKRLIENQVRTGSF
jgi:rubrerythrin